LWLKIKIVRAVLGGVNDSHLCIFTAALNATLCSEFAVGNCDVDFFTFCRHSGK